MERRRSTRQRGVALTKEALELLEAALHRQWRANGCAGKLTNERRAELLDVSIATVARILQLRAVDRSTLITCFVRCDLEWKDGYAQAPAALPREDASSAAEPREAVDAVPPTPAKRSSHWGWTAIALASLYVFMWTWLSRDLNADLEPAWKGELGRLVTEGTDAYHGARYAEAKELLDRALALAVEQQHAGGIASALLVRAEIAAAEGELHEARRYLRGALNLRELLNQDLSKAATLESLGNLEIRLGNYDEARRALLASLEIRQAHGDTVGVALCYRGLGSLSARQHDDAEALRWFQRALDTIKPLDKPDIVADVEGRRALVLRDQGRFEEARQILLGCQEHWQRSGHPRWQAQVLMDRATVEISAGNYEAGMRLLEISKASFAELGDKARVADCEEWATRAASAG